LPSTVRWPIRVSGVAEALDRDLTLLAYDLPSHGKSADWDAQGNVHDVATDMARALITEPMDIIRHTFGATVGLRLAIKARNWCAALRCSNRSISRRPCSTTPTALRQMMATARPSTRRSRAVTLMEAPRVCNTRWGDGSGWEKNPEKLRQYMADRIHFAPASQPFLRDDSAGLLKPGMFARATMPVLLMDGATSGDLANAISTSLEARLPHVTRRIIAGAGHMAPLTHPVDFANEARAFLQAA
jgi:lipase